MVLTSRVLNIACLMFSSSSHHVLLMFSLCLPLSVSQVLLIPLQSGSYPDDRPDPPVTLHAFTCFLLPGQRGDSLLDHSTHTFPTPNTIVCSIFSHEATATVKHHQWFFPNLLSVCFLVSSRSIVRPGCTTSHTSCSQQWVSHPVLSFCLSVILSGIILVFVFLCWPLLVLSVCVCVCVCAGHSLDPNHGPYHVHPAHIHDGPSHPAARPPVSWQHRHGQYPYHYTIHQPHTQTKVFKV